MIIKVTNIETGATYTHKHLSKNDVGWIALTPTLKIEILKR